MKHSELIQKVSAKLTPEELNLLKFENRTVSGTNYLNLVFKTKEDRQKMMTKLFNITTHDSESLKRLDMSYGQERYGIKSHVYEFDLR